MAAISCVAVRNRLCKGMPVSFGSLASIIRRNKSMLITSATQQLTIQAGK
jgi:hypothetical protein